MQYMQHQLFSRASTTALLVGNITSENAVKIAEGIVEKLSGSFGMAPTVPAEVPESRGVRLDAGCAWWMSMDAPNPDEGNTACLVTF
jgi:hypothetical protein